jgi:hypothetical protein
LPPVAVFSVPAFGDVRIETPSSFASSESLVALIVESVDPKV